MVRVPTGSAHRPTVAKAGRWCSICCPRADSVHALSLEGTGFLHPAASIRHIASAPGVPAHHQKDLMTELLPNYAAGRWQTGHGPGTVLKDPVLGQDLVRVDSTGLDLREAFRFARERAAPHCVR